MDKIKESASSSTPPLPPNHQDRCHAYNHKKRRYCRQLIKPHRPSNLKLDKSQTNEITSNHNYNEKPIYCGNHYHLYYVDDRNNGNNRDDDATTVTTKTKNNKNMNNMNNKVKDKRGRRIPCPIDPSHQIYEKYLEKHLKKCPKLKQMKEEKSRVYYNENINKGGHGPLVYMSNTSIGGTDDGISDTASSTNDDNSEADIKHVDISPGSTIDESSKRLVNGSKENSRNDKNSDEEKLSLDQAKELAFQVLATYHFLFLQSCHQDRHNATNTQRKSSTESNGTTKKNKESKGSIIIDDTYLQSLTYDDLYNAIPVQDYSEEELARGIEHDLQTHRIKIGGKKHLSQITSMVGHARKDGLFMSDGGNNSTSSDTSDTTSKDGKSVQQSSTVLELGAGRGTTGFVFASTMAADLTTASSSSGEEKEESMSKGTRLIMVERGSSRSKADIAFRRQQNKDNDRGDQSKVPVRHEKEANQRNSNMTKPGASPSMNTTPTTYHDDSTSPKKKKSRDIISSTKNTSESSNGDVSTSKSSSQNIYLDVDKVSVERIKCDLAHVNLPVALNQIDKGMSTENNSKRKQLDMSKSSAVTCIPCPDQVLDSKESSQNENVKNNGGDEECRDILVIAKHLCGAGTDLALKSICNISRRVSGCIMATCCHGLCNWDDYVGRKYLYKVMDAAHCRLRRSSNNDKTCASEMNESKNKEKDDGVDNCKCINGKVKQFTLTENEFDVLRRWSSLGALVQTGKVVPDDEKVNDNSLSHLGSNSSTTLTRKRPIGELTNLGNESQPLSMDNEHNDHAVMADNEKSAVNIHHIVDTLKLKCGANGLGRACQRLIDYGRMEYMKEVLMNKNIGQVSMCHYTSLNITPQNAMLKAHYGSQ